MKQRMYKTVIILALCISGLASAETRLQVFDKTSYQTLLNTETQQSFLLVLWSLDCPPCMDELSMLGNIHQQYPDKKIILVSTDSMSQRDAIIKVVNEFGLAHLPQWVFGDESAQYLRYTIDPAWYGELPRSYFHSTDKRTAVTGKLKANDVLRWFDAG